MGLAEGLSWLCGWSYFLAWSLSCTPLAFQAILNIQRRTTQGVEPDFWLLNIVGFACYTLSTACFLYSPIVRHEYALRHPISPTPTVRFNDLVFGIHSLVLSIVTYSQFFPALWGFRKANVKRHANAVTWGLVVGGAVAMIVVVCIVLFQDHDVATDNSRWGWIDVVYTTSFIKLLLTVFKYVPQALANFHRRSTIGWSIVQQLLDFTGGVLSLIQLMIDSSLQGDWSGLTGNPMKLGLSNISLLFDIIFILQHYVFFGPVEETNVDSVAEDREHGPTGEQQPLIFNRQD